MERANGYTALTTVLIISAVLLLTVVSVTVISINEAQSGLAVSQSESHLQLAESCLEEALEESRKSINYISETITLPEGSCTISVQKTVSAQGTIWEVTATPATTAYRRAVKATFTRDETLTISSWREI